MQKIYWEYNLFKSPHFQQLDAKNSNILINFEWLYKKLFEIYLRILLES